jgi:tetratricopeptide (TPR) repeat protein
MPPKSYMVVDPRHDHSMRVPRPDLSVELGVPNACNNCHSKKSNEWAAKQVRKWYGHVPKGLQDYGDVFSAARKGNPSSAKKLQQLAQNSTTPAIARATAIAELGRFLSVHSVTTVVDALYDADAMVRRAAILALANTEPGVRVKLIFPLLDDPVLAVRLEAARVLASIPMPQLDTNQQQRLSTVLDEYKHSLAVNADRPESQVELGVLLMNQGQIGAAKAAYQRALELDAKFVPAYVNLADLYASRGREDKALETLEKGIGQIPDSATLHHAMGLSLVRAKRHNEALVELKKATELTPTSARYYYVYGVALHSLGQKDQGIRILETANQTYPFDRDILSALVAFYRETGDGEMAQRYTSKLLELPE